MEKQANKLGRGQMQYLLLRIEQGATNADILSDSALQNLTPENLRCIRSRYKKKQEATKPQPENVTATEMQQCATPETDTTPAENEPKQPEKAGFSGEFAKAFHPADLLYYTCVAIAGAGFVQALQAIGYAVAGIFFCVALLALHFVKVRNGWARLPHLLALALVEIGGFIAHLSWANGRLWSNVKALPLDIWVNKYRNDAGEMVLLYGGADVDKPFYIACGVAAVMLFCGVYVVAIAIQNSQKSDNA